MESTVVDGVGEFNFGYASVISSLQKANISPGRKRLVFARAPDRRRKIKIDTSKSDRQEKKKDQSEDEEPTIRRKEK